MDWFLYDNGLRHERVKRDKKNNLVPSKLNQDLSQIKCFQCPLLIENSKCFLFLFELND